MQREREREREMSWRKRGPKLDYILHTYCFPPAQTNAEGESRLFLGPIEKKFS